MKAIIKYGIPEEYIRYCDLPIFDTKPRIHIMIPWYDFRNEFKDFHIDGKEINKQWYVVFIPELSHTDTNDIGWYKLQLEFYYGINGVNLTDDQIREINEMYFVLLDNPDIKQATIWI